MAEIIKEDQNSILPSNRKTLYETIQEIFNPYDMVGVKNITELDLSIPYLPSRNEKIITSNTTKKVYGREELTEDGFQKIPGKRETLKIKSQETAVIPGEMAYVVIPHIIYIQLQLESRNRPKTVDTGADPIVIKERETRQRELLQEIYLGLSKSSKVE